MITAQVIKDLNSSNVLYVSGSSENIAEQVLPPDLASPTTLVFASKQEQLEAAIKSNAPIIVAQKTLSLPTDSKSTFFTTGSIPLAMATLLPLFDGKMNRFSQEVKIHPTAIIHETAHIGENTIIGPYAIIGAHVQVSIGCTIGAHTVIESHAIVGAHTLLHPQVFIGAHCILGTHCEIHPHTTIGADGFAFVLNKEKQQQKIPQIGIVQIGDRVEIGANCAIDRAALTVTKIGNDTKFDNLCHIAHNCVIGSNCVFAAGFMIAGSSTIGDNCMFGGNSIVTDHITICSGVMVGGKSGVTNNITQPGAYSGYPIEPFKDSIKTLVNLKYLTKIRKDLSRVLKHLNLNAEE